MAGPAACIRAKAEEWLGAQVCSPPAVRGHAALGLGRVVEVNGGNVTVQYYAMQGVGQHPDLAIQRYTAGLRGS